MEPILTLGAIAAVTAIGLFSTVKIVPQSKNYVIERLGKYHATLKPGLHLLIPGIDNIAHRVSVLETQLPEYPIDAITKDNAPIRVNVATFYRRLNAEHSVYRIGDVENGIQTMVTGIVRSQIGQIDFDELQADRQRVNRELEQELERQAEEWGIKITRSEIVDVNFDDETRHALQQQMTAERNRRAAVTQAEGNKRAVELQADGELYAAQKIAEARRIEADAEAYATQVIADAIKENGDAPIRFELVRRQIDAIAKVGASDASKTILLPADMANGLPGLCTLAGEMLEAGKGATTSARG